jgi:predicted flap endonuclease-1-like 5' DNA nuclease
MGFKLHLIINNKGEIMAIKITKGNASDLSAVSGIGPVLRTRLFGTSVLKFVNIRHIL